MTANVIPSKHGIHEVLNARSCQVRKLDFFKLTNTAKKWTPPKNNQTLNATAGFNAGVIIFQASQIQVKRNTIIMYIWQLWLFRIDNNYNTQYHRSSAPCAFCVVLIWRIYWGLRAANDQNQP